MTTEQSFELNKKLQEYIVLWFNENLKGTDTLVDAQQILTGATFNIMCNIFEMAGRTEQEAKTATCNMLRDFANLIGKDEQL